MNNRAAQDDGGSQSGGPVFRAPPVVLASIGVLVAIHAGLWLAGEDWRIWALYAFAFIPARFGAAAFPMIPGSQYWSFLSHGLLHANAAHLLFNSLWFLIFGSVTARRLGALRFLALAAAATAAGALASLFVHWGEAAILVGASGAVSGIMAAAIPVMFGRGMSWGRAYTEDLNHVEALSPVELLRNRSAVIFALVWIAITLYSGATGWTGAGYLEEARIAWEAHLGGFIAGLFGFYMLDRRGVRDRNRSDRVTPR
ncbi:MAG: rhomboid family intramembrane serine protease [Hyphomicrobiales bacterium]